MSVLSSILDAARSLPRLPLVAAGGGLVLVAALWLVASPYGAPDAAVASQSRRVAALGYIEPSGEVIDLAAPAGERITRVVVQEGDRVEAGEPLAYLEAHDERVVERELIAAQLREAEASLEAESARGDALVRGAELTFERLEITRPLEIAAARSRVEALEAELENASRDLERFRDLQRSDAAAEVQLEQRATAESRVRAELETARAELSQLEATRELDIQQAGADIASARAGRSLARLGTRVESLRRRLELARVRARRTIISAPRGGTILDVIIRPGEAPPPAGPILLMGDLTTMYVLAEVYETDIGSVEVGQPATISSPALPTELTGVVERVGKIILRNRVLDLDPAADADRRIAEVLIRLDDPEVAASLVNLQVTAEIEVDGS